MKAKEIHEMTNEELERCVQLFEGMPIDDGDTIENFCKGTARFYGKTIQELADDSGVAPNLVKNGVFIPKINFPNLPYFEFTIDGKNTYTKEDIWYEIVLNHGDEHATRTTRIRDDLLKFTLLEVVDGTVTLLRSNITPEQRVLQSFFNL